MVIVHEPIKVAEHLDKYSESRGMSHSAAFYEWVTFGDHLMRELQETKKYIIRNLSSNGRFEFKTAEDQKRYTYLANVDLILSMNKQDPHDTPPDPGEVGRLTPDLKGRFKRQCMKVKTDTWKYWMACAKKEGLSTRDWVIRRIWVSMAVLHTTDELRRTISNAILNQTIQKDMETYTGLQEFVDAVDTIASRVWVPAFDKFQKAQASFLKNLNKDGPLAEIPNRANRNRPKQLPKPRG